MRETLNTKSLRLGCAVIAALSLLAACSNKRDIEWKLAKQMVRQKYPDVAQTRTAELSAMMTAPAEQRPIILDARSPEEYAVSHLQDARLTTTEEQALAALKDVKKDQPVVVYCAVGARASALAEKLMKHGFTKVSNLEGAIFAWANEGRPVYRDGQPVRQVHPVSGRWGELLREDLRAPLVDAKK